MSLPFALQLANLGADAAMAANPHLKAGLNVMAGEVVHPEVIAALADS